MMLRRFVRVPGVNPDRIDVHRGLHQRRQCVEERVPNLFGDGVTLGRRQLPVHVDIQFSPLPVADPARRHVVHCQHTRHAGCRALNLIA